MRPGRAAPETLAAAMTACSCCWRCCSCCSLPARGCTVGCAGPAAAACAAEPGGRLGASRGGEGTSRPSMPSSGDSRPGKGGSCSRRVAGGDGTPAMPSSRGRSSCTPWVAQPREGRVGVMCASQHARCRPPLQQPFRCAGTGCRRTTSAGVHRWQPAARRARRLTRSIAAWPRPEAIPAGAAPAGASTLGSTAGCAAAPGASSASADAALFCRRRRFSAPGPAVEASGAPRVAAPPTAAPAPSCPFFFFWLVRLRRRSLWRSSCSQPASQPGGGGAG